MPVFLKDKTANCGNVLANAILPSGLLSRIKVCSVLQFAIGEASWIKLSEKSAYPTLIAGCRPSMLAMPRFASYRYWRLRMSYKVIGSTGFPRMPRNIACKAGSGMTTGLSAMTSMLKVMLFETPSKSLTPMVTYTMPVCPRFGVTTKARLSQNPATARPESGITAWFEDLTETARVQGSESESLMKNGIGGAVALGGIN